MHVFETPGSVSLQVKLPSGRVLVTTADEPRTTVEVVAVGRRGQDAIDEIEVTMDERLGRYAVKVEQKDRFRWGPIQITWGGDFECRIVCPPGTDLDLAGGSTDLRSDGELGEVSVRTASGDIRLESARGDAPGQDGERRHLGRRDRRPSIARDGVGRSRSRAGRRVRSRRGRSPATSRSGASRRSSRSRPRRATSTSSRSRAATCAFRPCRATSAWGSRRGHAPGSTPRRSRAIWSRSSGSTRSTLPRRTRLRRSAARQDGER